MKLTAAVAALLCGTKAFECQRGLTLETYSTDECKAPHSDRITPTEADLKKRCKAKVEMSQP